MAKIFRPQKRSVSPFGLIEEPQSPFQFLMDAYQPVFKKPDDEEPKFEKWEDAFWVPFILEDLCNAPANDAQGLSRLTGFLLNNWPALEDAGLASDTYKAMEKLFESKTSIFLVDHQNKEQCEKMEWPDEYRDTVLFSKERDVLIGEFFGPVTEKAPGRFAEFINKWAQTESPDRALHFIDFCAGSKNPTFEYHLLFTHPALKKLAEDKKSLRQLMENAKGLLERLKSPTWEQDVRKTFIES